MYHSGQLLFLHVLQSPHHIEGLLPQSYLSTFQLLLFPLISLHRVNQTIIFPIFLSHLMKMKVVRVFFLFLSFLVASKDYRFYSCFQYQVVEHGRILNQKVIHFFLLMIQLPAPSFFQESFVIFATRW